MKKSKKQGRGKMYKLKVGRKGILDAAEKETGCDIASGYTERILCTCMTKTPDPKYHDETCPISKRTDYNPDDYKIPNIN